MDERQESIKRIKMNQWAFSFLSGCSHEVSQELRRRKQGIQCTFFSGCSASSLASSLRSTTPLPTAWLHKTLRLETRPSKVMSYYRIPVHWVAENALLLGCDLWQACPSWCWWARLQFAPAFSLLPRSQLAASVGLWESCIPPGLVKTHRNSLGLPSLTHSIRLSIRRNPDTQGSPKQSTGTERA